MAFSHDGSRRLALELQFQEVQDLRPRPAKRGKKRKADDFEIAMELYGNLLATEIEAVGGRVPILADPQPPTRPRKRAATRRNKVHAAATRSNPPRQAKAASLRPAVPTQLSTPPAEQADHSTTDERAVATALRCTACDDEQQENSLIRTTCGHFYCASCLVVFFTNATIDESMFPPSCCAAPIPLDHTARKFLSTQLIERFEQKRIEFTTTNRRYCHNARCATFLPPSDFRDDHAQCTACNRWTCILCHAAAHEGVCPNDPEAELLREMARRSGWRACPACGKLVERTSGCAHMRQSNLLLYDKSVNHTDFYLDCICHTHFCYGCGYRLNACTCRG